MEGGRTVMADDVDRHAPNPNRVTQTFDRIGKGEDMSEMQATERYWWSQVRCAMKGGRCSSAGAHLIAAEHENGVEFGLALRERVARTFAAGCAALGDPAPLENERDRICKNCQSWRQFSGKKDGFCSASLDQGFGATVLALDDEGLGTDSDFGCVRFVDKDKEQDHE